MDQLLTFAQQWWWAGLIPSLIGVMLYFWHKHYQKTHVESQFIIEGITLTTIIMIYYLICIVSAILSLIAGVIKIFKFLG
jgi:hypothetical protein